MVASRASWFLILAATALASASATAQTLPNEPFLLQNAKAYCEREPEECRLPEGPARPEIAQAILPLLERVNREINASLAFRLDREQYGAPDFWTIPATGQGDCEDYALAKRRLLIDAGVDPRNLRITLVRFFENGKQVNHAILGAVTDRGMRYLDMNTDQVGDALASVIRFGYRFVAMQSESEFTVYNGMNEPLLTAAVAGKDL